MLLPFINCSRPVTIWISLFMRMVHPSADLACRPSPKRLGDGESLPKTGQADSVLNLSKSSRNLL